MKKIIVSHRKGLWVTCKDSQIILKVCMTLCELFLLTGNYSWPPKTLGLRLEVGWLQECVGNTFGTKCFWIQKVS